MLWKLNHHNNDTRQNVRFINRFIENYVFANYRSHENIGRTTNWYRKCYMLHYVEC